MFGASLGQSSFNLGNTLGSYLGGIPLVLGFSYASPQWVGALLSFLGALLGSYLYYREKFKHNTISFQTWENEKEISLR